MKYQKPAVTHFVLSLLNLSRNPDNREVHIESKQRCHRVRVSGKSRGYEQVELRMLLLLETSQNTCGHISIFRGG